MNTDELITEEWLSARGWKLTTQRNDNNTQLPGFRLRPVAPDCLGWRQPFQSHDDLCIAVAPYPPNSDWHVWIYQIEPYRSIHVRHMRYTWELIRLWEGLTGKPWEEPDGGKDADSYKLNPGGFRA
ncbi:MAG TPA: hypothetical protein VGE74_05870 [Gemmata sp.]